MSDVDDLIRNLDKYSEFSPLLRKAAETLYRMHQKDSGLNAEKTVSMADYTRVIIALKRCHSLMSDVLLELPAEKQQDMRIYLNILGDMSSDASVYASVHFLEEVKTKDKPRKRRQK